jgi:hypothetical protein
MESRGSATANDTAFTQIRTRWCGPKTAHEERNQETKGA